MLIQTWEKETFARVYMAVSDHCDTEATSELSVLSQFYKSDGAASTVATICVGLICSARYARVILRMDISENCWRIRSPNCAF